MKLPSQDSATGRAIKTFIQALGGFIIGLGVAIWQVPGVPDAVQGYIVSNLPQVIVTIGIPVAVSSGAISFIWNYFRKNVSNY
jgi:hypothetical protein